MAANKVKPKEEDMRKWAVTLFRGTSMDAPRNSVAGRTGR